MSQTTVRNVHERRIPAGIDAVVPWIDRVWSGEADDVFPHDRLVAWRERGDGGSLAWVPAQTRFGHANIRFKLRRWDGTRWEADMLSKRFPGWQGFELEPDGAGTRIRHVLEGTPHGWMRWGWPAAVRPLHDWAVEATFDRLEQALATGRAPVTTARPMGRHARLAYQLLDRLGHGALSGLPHGARNNWGATDDEMRQRCDCDRWIVAPDERLYRAVTIEAPAALVYRWLCQLQVAPYSYDWIDNGGRQSPPQLTPGLEQLQRGARAMSIFELVDFEPDKQITLRLASPSAARVFGDLAITYRVASVAPGQTRLIGKLVVHYPRSLVGRALRRVLPWGDLVMMRKQLLTLKALAERDAQAE